jgi:hypothetical protein
VRGRTARGTGRPPARPRRSAVALVLLLVTASASVAAAKDKDSKAPAHASLEELWIEPRDIGSRDLFHGPGGPSSAPDPRVPYRVTGKDTKGHSSGYDVEGPDGRKWDVKTGEESKTEVAVSRILWAIGYHQPVMHRLESWRIEGQPEAPEPGRFRLASDHKTEGDWSWLDNPFVGTRPFHGLVVANLVLNNWDFTTSNNRIYRMPKGAPGPERRFVAQDVGGALGKTRWPVGTRDKIDQFEKQDLIREVDGDRVVFEYRARHQGLVKDIPKEDVVWVCRLLAQLSEKQLDDAFRAAGYPADVRARFVRKIRSKIEEGLALDAGREKKA